MRKAAVSIHESDRATIAAKTSNLSLRSTSSFLPSAQLPLVTGSKRIAHTTKPLVQPKLKIGQSDDKYEQEADRVAEQVMRMPDSSSLASEGTANTISISDIQLMSPECEEELQCRFEEDQNDDLVQAKEQSGSVSAVFPYVASNIASLLGSGRLLSDSIRSFFEPRFGHNLSHVRVHNDRHAAKMARSINARAFTIGNDVVFGQGQFSASTDDGRRLIAHELTHTVQQAGYPANQGLHVQRRVADQYSTIEDRLSYGVFDWAITDDNARDVLEILNGLSERDFADTVVAMDRDGYLERLLDNISESDQERFAVLIGRVNSYRPTIRTFERIEDRLSYGFFDWAITDQDAHDVLVALMGLGSQQLRAVVARMINDGFFDRLLDNVGEEDSRRFASFIRRLQDIRAEFRTLVSSQLSYLRRPRDVSDSSDPGSAGRRIRRTVRTTGYGGQEPSFGDLPDERQRDWRRRAREAIAEVESSVQGTHLGDILSRSRIVFDPEGAERLGTRPGSEAYAYVTGENVLHVGRSWVRDVEENVRNVWQSIAHELGGHDEFGFTWSYQIMRATVRRLGDSERREALGDVHSLYSAYGYLETELYAELRELEYRLPTSGGDRPSVDVPRLLRRILAAFGPAVGREIIVRFYYRVLGDVRITQGAKQFLYDAVQSVVPGGLFPLSSPVGP